MIPDTLLMTWVLGLVSGMRHAFEPDHLAAVSTLVAEGYDLRRAVWLGAWWGLGHTAALLGVSVAAGVLQADLSPGAEQALEGAVGLMLLGLGGRAIRRGLADMRGGADAWHAHAGHAHRHPTTGRHVHVGTLTLSPRSFAIGLVHGLAGSGALVAAAATGLPSMPARLVYVLLFGFGSVAAMAGTSGIAGWRLARWVGRPQTRGALQLVTGTLSLLVGAIWVVPILGDLA